jgi:hypothetical protein
MDRNPIAIARVRHSKEEIMLSQGEVAHADDIVVM